MDDGSAASTPRVTSTLRNEKGRNRLRDSGPMKVTVSGSNLVIDAASDRDRRPSESLVTQATQGVRLEIGQPAGTAEGGAPFLFVIEAAQQVVACGQIVP